MDFNDVKSRLERVYSSVNATIDNNVLNNAKLVHEKTESGGIISLTFDYGNDESVNLNKIFTIIHNLANLKDILKNKLKSRGECEQMIEDEINKSDFIKLIIDLSNQEKHGYPLTKIRRSLRDPKIVNIEKGLGISQKSNVATFIFSPFGGEMQSENCTIYLCADIIDSSGNHLSTLDELINGSIIDWENILNKFNLKD